MLQKLLNNKLFIPIVVVVLAITVGVIIGSVFIPHKQDQTKIDSLKQDSLRVHITCDSLNLIIIEKEQLIQERNERDSLKMQEYEKLFNSNKSLTKSELHRVFTGT